MSPTMKTLGIDQLRLPERIALAHEIWDSIAAESKPPYLSEAQGRELDRRLADHKAHPENVVPWEQIKAETLKRLNP